MRILLIEDDRETALVIKEDLQRFFVVETAFTGEEGQYLAEVNKYNVILLDYLLPDVNGIEVCKRLRTSGIATPIIMVTGQYQIQQKILALNSGCDDYITKPFNIDELLARIRAVIRRQNRFILSNTITIDDLTIDISSNTVTRKENVIRLRRKELYLLEYLMRNAGNIVTRQMILDHVWESYSETGTNIVDVHIKYLRDRVDKPFQKKLIKTIHGLGYKMEL